MQRSAFAPMRGRRGWDRERDEDGGDIGEALCLASFLSSMSRVVGQVRPHESCMGRCGETSQMLHRQCLTSFAAVRRVLVCGGAVRGNYGSTRNLAATTHEGDSDLEGLCYII